MRLFTCPECGQPLHFENTVCLGCGRNVGYLPEQGEMIAVEADGPIWRRPSTPDDGPWRFCGNWEESACNWLVADLSEGALCRACIHNRLIPDLTDPNALALWRKMEGAKRRLIYGLLQLGLPPQPPVDDAVEPLVFDFPADTAEGQAMTGHATGEITIALAEADDATREARRTAMGEPYRTLLGHFRHEIGHFEWDRLVRDAPDRLAEFRQIFGDDREDYAAALERHYQAGAPADWQSGYISTYATAHPWEDWAETWAHYLHIIDAMELAGALGIAVGHRRMAADAYRGSPVEEVLRDWVPLTVALNGLNRSMGLPDLYPFVLSQPVADKLGFVEKVVRGSAS